MTDHAGSTVEIALYNDPRFGTFRVMGAVGARVIMISSAVDPTRYHRIAEEETTGDFRWTTLTDPAAIAARNLGVQWLREQARTLRDGGEPFPLLRAERHDGIVVEWMRPHESLLARLAAAVAIEVHLHRERARRTAESNAPRPR